MTKITVVGAGNVGATTAHLAALKNLGEIVLVDVIEGLPQGKCLDIMHSANLEGFHIELTGSNDYAPTKDTDIVVITAGLPRKPGMTREDLLNKNAEIVKDVISKVLQYNKNPLIVTVTNPLDAMNYLVWKLTKFPRTRVIGMGGALDSTRFAYYVSKTLNVSVNNIDAMVIGSHGAAMIPLARFTTVKGRPLTEIAPADKVQAIVNETVNAGTTIVKFLKTGSAYYAPASAICSVLDAIVHNKHKIIPCSIVVDGEYGIKLPVSIGMPVKLGKEGVEEIIQLNLTEDEKKAFEKGAQEIYELTKLL